MRNIFSLFIYSIAIFTLFSCKKEKVDPPKEEEPFVEIRYTFAKLATYASQAVGSPFFKAKIGAFVVTNENPIDTLVIDSVYVGFIFELPQKMPNFYELYIESGEEKQKINTPDTMNKTKTRIIIPPGSAKIIDVFSSIGYVEGGSVKVKVAISIGNLGQKRRQTSDFVVGQSIVPQKEKVEAGLSPTTLLSREIKEGQSSVELAQFRFTGTGNIVDVVLERSGVSANATLSNTILYDGATALTGAKITQSNGEIGFYGINPVILNKNTKVITVKSDIAAGSAGQTVGVKLISYTVVNSQTGITETIKVDIPAYLMSITK